MPVQWHILLALLWLITGTTLDCTTLHNRCSVFGMSVAVDWTAIGTICSAVIVCLSSRAQVLL